MIRLLHRYSKHRLAWLLLAFTASSLELVVLYFQHILLIKPCVLCIYQRCALYGIISAGLIGALFPKTLLRFVSLIIWLYSAWKGLYLAIKHTNIYLNPSPFVTCEFFVNFPSWLPLDKYLPSIFSINGDCTVRQGYFLSLQIPQWMVIIFSAYLAVAVIVFFVQFFPPRKT
ncbi:Disulfide bond formation protein B [Candidatus Gullanella endobia]|uniref:Disulfide bond formation protein B n=1 Tax=Candidatus Gullanella endobia TaxID=1070130 RepID=A0A143WQF2_9ENTR|nr:disulfide bond formation protein DsbB [Candidatus Gullanella endobia]CUX95940.1 Disulfide bond formation protein B [Candidatus Gullanella endobia]